MCTLLRLSQSQLGNLATEIAGNCTHACVISVDLPYFWPTSPNAEQGVKYFALFSPTSLNAEQDLTKWKIFNLAIMPRSCSQIVCLWLHIVIFVFVFLQLCFSVISVFAPRLIRFPSNFIILALWCT